MKQFIAVCAIFSLFALLCACGGGHSTSQQAAQVAVSLNPASATSLVNQITKFTPSVTGTANTAVTWSIKEQNAGTMNAGTYQAPWAVGTYHVVATSVADPTKSASAEVRVSAKFAFIQQLPDGTSQPISVTPMLGTINPDGTFTQTGINDPETGKPLDTAIYDIVLSPDGKTALFTMFALTTPDAEYYTENICSAAVDGSALTQLTNSVSGDQQRDTSARFSPDGKTIVYVHWIYEGSDNLWDESIRTMNADGTDQKQIIASGVGPLQQLEWVVYPTFSSDGKKIALEAGIYHYESGESTDGIAIMNADGTNLTQLTSPSYADCNGYGWDTLPAYTNDGSGLSYTRECWPEAGGVQSTVYLAKLDGTGEQIIGGQPPYSTPGLIACQPTPVADAIMMSGNLDNIGTAQFEIYQHYKTRDPVNGAGVRLTNNSVYDGFSATWMSSFASVEQRTGKKLLRNPVTSRIEHHKMLQQRHHR